jgi:arylsulfatase A-like enzyme
MKRTNLACIPCLAAALVACVLMHGSVSAAGPRPGATAQPNIVFVEVDDLTYSYAGCFGSLLAKTPHIDSLARRGVLFKNATCQGMMCGPSRNGLITGLYPHNLGFYRNGQMRQLPQGVWTLPKALQRAGYYTAWVGKCHVRPYGLSANSRGMETEMGFDFVRQTAGRAVLGSSKRKRPNDWYYQHLQAQGLLEHFKTEFPKPSSLPEDDYLDGLFTKTAIDFLDSYDAAKPLFLWLNYSLPHGPYDVSQKYLDQFSPAAMPGSTEAQFTPPAKLVADAKPIRSEKRAKEMQAAYCGAIMFLDRQIGRLLETLKQKEMIDNTVIVFFSDHGVMMGAQGRRHKGTLFRPVTNPALIIAWPARFRQNAVADQAVELTDLLRTSLDLAHASAEDKRSTRSVSLLPLLTGQGEYERRVAFAEIEGYVVAVCDGYRYIEGKDASLLFNDDTDPDNLVDLSAQEPERVARLSQEIKNWLQETAPVLPKNSH